MLVLLKRLNCIRLEGVEKEKAPKRKIVETLYYKSYDILLINLSQNAVVLQNRQMSRSNIRYLTTASQSHA